MMVRLLALSALLLAAPAAGQSLRTDVSKLAETADFNGTLLISKGDAPALQVHNGKMWLPNELERQGDRIKGRFLSPEFGTFSSRDRWRWASVTKQVIATLILQEVAKGTIALDQPLTTYLPAFRGPKATKTTIRHLLRHQSGLPNPDDTTPDTSGVPGYYSPSVEQDRTPTAGWCAGSPKAEPGGNWTYNNCDFIVAGAVLEAVTGKNWQQLVRDRIAKPLGLKSLAAFPKPQITVQGFIKEAREPAYQLGHFGSSAALYGTPYDLWKFDRALMTGKLLPKAQLDEMWDGKPELGFIALGQWVFEAGLKSCPKPVRIVERRGAIGGVQVRNFILPDNDMVVIAFTNRGEFEFGEIWQGIGFAHDLLDRAVCQPVVRQ